MPPFFVAIGLPSPREELSTYPQPLCHNGLKHKSYIISMGYHYHEDFTYAKTGSNRQKIDNVGQKIFLANELGGVLGVYFS